ncbi:MAG: glycosyltransferase family 4 protein [Phycisphaerae bacterium]
MIKVGHVVTSYSSAVTILKRKLAALNAYDDLDVVIITGPVPERLNLSPPPVRHLVAPLVRPISPVADLKCVWALKNLFRREEIDIVHTHTSKAGVVGAIAARLARVPLVLHTYHGLAFYDGQSRRQYHAYRLIEAAVSHLRHHVFSQNRRDVEECGKLMGSPHRVTYEGNGVDIPEVRRSADENIHRAENDYPPGAFRIAMISRLEPVKCVSDFLEACTLLQRTGLDYSVVIAGRGPLEAALRKEITDRSLDQRVRLLGWTNHVHALMAAADVVVLTSAKEGLPRAVLEAMALARPVVATDVPGTQEVVIHNETGYLAPLGQPRVLGDHITALADNADLRRRFGQAGRSRVREHFNDEKIAASLREFYIRHQRVHKPRKSW